MATVSLFWNTNMADVKSCEKGLSKLPEFKVGTVLHSIANNNKS